MPLERNLSYAGAFMGFENETGGYSRVSPHLTISEQLAMVVVSVMILFGTFGNVLVVGAVFTQPFMRKPPNYFLAMLASVDFFVATAVNIMQLKFITHGNDLWVVRGLCDFAAIICTVSCLGSVLCNMAIAINRVVAIKWPFMYNTLYGKSRIIYHLIAIALYVGLYDGLHFILPGHSHRYDYQARICTYNRNMMITSFGFSLTILLCVITVTISYSIALVKLRKLKLAAEQRSAQTTRSTPSRKSEDVPDVKHLVEVGTKEKLPLKSKISKIHVLEVCSRNKTTLEVVAEDEGGSILQRSEDSDNGNLASMDFDISIRGPGLGVQSTDFKLKEKRKKASVRNKLRVNRRVLREKELMVTMMALFVYFLISWLPWSVLTVIHNFVKFGHDVFMWTVIMGHQSSSFNFVIYWVTNRKFRLAYKNVLRSVFGRKPPSYGSPGSTSAKSKHSQAHFRNSPTFFRSQIHSKVSDRHDVYMTT